MRYVAGSSSTFRTCLLATFLFTVRSIAAADDPPPPSFTKDIKPFLAKYCMECHNVDDADSGLVVETHESLLKGGERGAALVPGKPDESRLVLQVEGKAKPQMPPKAANQPKPEEIALVRAWVAAGAKNDLATGDAPQPNLTLPPIQPRGEVPPKIAAAVYSADGKILVVAAYNEVVLLNPADGTSFGKLTPPPPLAAPSEEGARGGAGVTALALSRDGRRLAVATGAAGQYGEVHFYAMPTLPVRANLKPQQTIRAHADLIHAMELSPNGKMLATGSYDRLVKLWNPETGSEIRTLKDHSDAVYGLAFSPDSILLATGAADRAVKVWEVVSGRRLYTLGEASDWIYAVAWSRDGKYLAAGGVDKSIRVWNATASEGKLIRSAFAHDAAITRLVYSSDSGTLYSLSEDRTVKAWDADQMVERQHFEPQPDTPLALALSADNREIAIGRYDGIISTYEAASGKKLREPIAVAQAKPAPKPEPSVLASVRPRGAQRGKTVLLVFDGKNLNNATEIVFAGSSGAGGITSKLVQDDETAKNVNRARADVTIPADAAPGIMRVSLKTPQGNTAELPFAITPYAELAEAAGNDSQSTAQKVLLPATLVGALGRAGDTDYYRFDVEAGRQLSMEVLADGISSKLNPVLTLIDNSGRVLAESTASLMGHTFAEAGSYTLRVRDVEYRGSDEMFYRVNLGDMPVIMNVFPLGLARGTEAEIQLNGVNLGDIKAITVKAPDAAEPGSRLELPVQLGAGQSKSLVVGEFPEVTEHGSNDELPRAQLVPTPVTINGRIEKPGDVDLFRFAAQKGQRLVLDVNARRIGSPLDSFIEILDLGSRPVPRATLRCLAKTYTTFRDHDSSSPGIRVESWGELAMNDYVMIGNDLLRIWELPKNPDDDMQFFQLRGARVGYLDTTPAHLSMGTPIYKVSLHPPGTQFPPNGMPIFTIPYRNDDGGPQYGKDSRLFFDPPADGEYLVKIGDVRGQGGPGHAYRLAIRPPRPSFTVSFSPTAPGVWKGGAIPLAVSCERSDGFEGPIDIRLEHLPQGYSAPTTAIPAGENSTALALFAEPDAPAPAKDGPPLKLVAKATIDGKELVREVVGGVPKVVEPGDIVATVDQSEVTLQPGGQARLAVKVERRNDFKGRIPIEVRGLPHGTRVLDIGLNGILITEQETTRTVVIYSEPWVAPTNHPFVVLAHREGKDADYAARSVLLRVLPPASLAAAPVTAAESAK